MPVIAEHKLKTEMFILSVISASEYMDHAGICILFHWFWLLTVFLYHKTWGAVDSWEPQRVLLLFISSLCSPFSSSQSYVPLHNLLWLLPSCPLSLSLKSAWSVKRSHLSQSRLWFAMWIWMCVSLYICVCVCLWNFSKDTGVAAYGRNNSPNSPRQNKLCVLTLENIQYDPPLI